MFETLEIYIIIPQGLVIVGLYLLCRSATCKSYSTWTLGAPIAIKITPYGIFNKNEKNKIT